MSTVALLGAQLAPGFPTVDADLPGYIRFAHTLDHARLPRAGWYGFTLVPALYGQSLWWTAVAQALATAFLLFRVARLFRWRNPLAVTLAIALACIYSSLGIHAAQLNPDIATPLLFLAIPLMVMSRKKVDQAVAAITILLALFFHLSNVLIAVPFTAFLFFWSTYKRWSSQPRFRRLFLYCLSCTILLWSLNRLTGVQNGLSNSWGAFMAERGYSGGLVRRYVDENCVAEDEAICQVAPNVRARQRFLWGAPVKKLGGVVDNPYLEKFSLDLIRRYPGAYSLAMLSSAVRQLFQFRVWRDGVLLPQHGLNGLKRWLSAEDRSRLTDSMRRLAGQKRRALVMLSWEAQWYAGIAAYISLLGFAWRGGRNRFMARILLTLVLMNGLITGALSGPMGRYQARVIWLGFWILCVAALNWAVETIVSRRKGRGLAIGRPRPKMITAYRTLRTARRGT